MRYSRTVALEVGWRRVRAEWEGRVGRLAAHCRCICCNCCCTSYSLACAALSPSPPHRRHLNIRGKSANLPAITDKDWADLQFG